MEAFRLRLGNLSRLECQREIEVSVVNHISDFDALSSTPNRIELCGAKKSCTLDTIIRTIGRTEVADITGEDA